jgi:hypothetical protein
LAQSGKFRCRPNGWANRRPAHLLFAVLAGSAALLRLLCSAAARRRLGLAWAWGSACACKWECYGRAGTQGSTCQQLHRTPQRSLPTAPPRARRHHRHRKTPTAPAASCIASGGARPGGACEGQQPGNSGVGQVKHQLDPGVGRVWLTPVHC